MLYLFYNSCAIYIIFLIIFSKDPCMVPVAFLVSEMIEQLLYLFRPIPHLLHKASFQLLLQRFSCICVLYTTNAKVMEHVRGC